MVCLLSWVCGLVDLVACVGFVVLLYLFKSFVVLCVLLFVRLLCVWLCLLLSVVLQIMCCDNDFAGWCLVFVVLLRFVWLFNNVVYN